VRWQGSVLADQLAVPVNLAGVFQTGEEQSETGSNVRRGRNVQVQAIPPKPGIGIVALRAPGEVGPDGFPTVLAGSVVDVWAGPFQAVADMKTPGAGEIDGAFAQPVDGDDRGRG
jgi:hypothetical protein